MKWIGQHIWKFISRFREDVYLEKDPGSSTDTQILVRNSSTGKVTYNTGAGDDMTFELGADGGSNQNITDGEEVTIAGGTDITTAISSTGAAEATVTVTHGDVDVASTTSSASPAHGATFTTVDALTVNARGHVEEMNTKTVTLPTAGGVTSNVAGDLIDVSGATGAVTINVDLSELTDGTADVVGSADELVYLDAGSQKRKQINEIKLGQFNNDQGWAAGDITQINVSTDAGLATQWTLGAASLSFNGGSGGITTSYSSGEVRISGKVNRAHFEFKGYGTGDGTNYEMPELMTDTNAPFEHNTSTGSDGLTAQTIQTVMRSGGVVMPYTGVLKKFTGWVTSAGSGTMNIGLFKVTPTDDSAGNLTPVLLVNEQTTASGNAIMNSFSETSSFDNGFTAGDIIYSAVLGISTKAWYFNSIIEVEWD